MILLTGVIDADVTYDEKNNTFIVPAERYKEFVQSEIERNDLLDLIDIKDDIIENLESIIYEQTAIINAREIINDIMEKERAAYQLTNKILGTSTIVLGVTTAILTIIIIAQ